MFPMNVEVMAAKLCSLITESLTKEDWEMYVGPITEEYPYDPNTCDFEY